MSILDKLLPKKCKICRKKILKDEYTSELKVKTSEGHISLKVCSDCGDFWEESSKILNKIGNKSGKSI